jgi:hypothetical protein
MLRCPPRLQGRWGPGPSKGSARYACVSLDSRRLEKSTPSGSAHLGTRRHHPVSVRGEYLGDLHQGRARAISVACAAAGLSAAPHFRFSPCRPGRRGRPCSCGFQSAAAPCRPVRSYACGAGAARGADDRDEGSYLSFLSGRGVADLEGRLTANERTAYSTGPLSGIARTISCASALSSTSCDSWTAIRGKRSPRVSTTKQSPSPTSTKIKPSGLAKTRLRRRGNPSHPRARKGFLRRNVCVYFVDNPASGRVIVTSMPRHLATANSHT